MTTNQTSPKENFLRGVRDHALTVVLDTPTHKHLTFKKPETTDMHYHLVTWPGYLAFSGDMGCFVFQRIPDMFSFFRDNYEDWGINPGYWAEKLQAEDTRTGGAYEFNADLCDQILDRYLDEFLEGLDTGNCIRDQEKAEDAKNAVEDFKADREDSEWDCVSRLNNWDADAAGGMDIDDWWDSNTKSYTHHYLWCCHAIVWSIRQYDALKAQGEPN